MINMNISNNIINKYASYYNFFRSATTKGSIGMNFHLGLNMIHRHTRTRVEIIFTDIAVPKS